MVLSNGVGVYGESAVWQYVKPLWCGSKMLLAGVEVNVGESRRGSEAEDTGGCARAKFLPRLVPNGRQFTCFPMTCTGSSATLHHHYSATRSALDDLTTLLDLVTTAAYTDRLGRLAIPRWSPARPLSKHAAQAAPEDWRRRWRWIRTAATHTLR